MIRSNARLALAVLPLLAVSTLSVPVAHAQDNPWGPWYKKECRNQRINSPFGGNNIETPQVPGAARSQECVWERKKNECPKLTSKLVHPIKCFIRYQKSGWLLNRPSD